MSRAAPTILPGAQTSATTPTTAPGELIYRAGTLSYTRRGLVWLFGWLLWGDFAWSVRDRALGDLIKVFMNYVKVSNSFVAFLTGTLPGLLNIGLQPIISYFSDRHRGRWGRRRPFLLIGVPLAGLSIVGMGLSPLLGRVLHRLSGTHTWGEAHWALACFAVCFIVYDVAAVLSGAVFGAFFNDVVPRNMLARFWWLVRAVSIGVVIVFMLFFFGLAKEHFSLICVGVGLIYAIGFTSAVLTIKEGEYPPVEGQRDTRRGLGAVFGNIFRGLVSYFRVCFSKPFYLWAFAAMILPNTLAFASLYSWCYFYATKRMGITEFSYGRLIALYFILSLPLTPLQGWLSEKIHPLRVAMIILALHVPASLYGWFYADDQYTYKIAFVATGLLQVLWGTATAALWPMLYPKETFAQLSSAAGFVGGILGMGYYQLAGWFLDYTSKINSLDPIGKMPAVEAPYIYNYTFLAAALLDILGLAATYILYKKFVELGGMKSYTPP